MTVQKNLLRVLLAGLAACDGPSQVTGSVADAPGVPNMVLTTTPVSAVAAAETGEKPYGCWVVNADETKVDGEWQYPCRVALPTKKVALPSNLDWPDAALVLPAIEAGPIPQAADHVEALLKSETASTGVAGLIYLPAALDGTGLYVAAWEGPAGEAGWSLGAYGAFPASVATPVGRAYLSAEFKVPARIRREPVADKPAVEEGLSTEEASSVESKGEPKPESPPKALEL